MRPPADCGRPWLNAPAVIALVREVPASLNQRMPVDGAHAPIDVKLARKQHGEFARVLGDLGVFVKRVPSVATDSGGIFMASMAVLVPEVGAMARSADSSRLAEVESVIPLLAQHRPIQRISDPGTLEGDDVLRIGRVLFAATSPGTNAEGVAELRTIMEPFGYQVRSIELRDCAHLNLAASFVPPHFLVVNPAWADPKEFGELVVIEVDESEPFAANTLSVAGTTLLGSGCPKTERRLRDAGIQTRRVEVSEFQKMEAGLSLLALLVEPRTARPASPPVGFKVVRSATAPVTSNLFAPAIVHGGVVYVSGQLPIEPTTGRIVLGEVEEQTDQVMRNLAEVLAASGSSLARLLRLTFYLADTKAVDRVMPICARALNGHHPAGSVVAAKLPHPGCAIAVDAVAAVAGEP